MTPVEEFIVKPVGSAGDIEYVIGVVPDIDAGLIFTDVPETKDSLLLFW
jgi:hypothetical protein